MPIQNINDICFSETGLLKDEFNRLYPALFEKADHHIAIIRALAEKRKGLSRTEIIQLAKIPNGSSSSRVLEELEQSDFIMAYHPFGKKKKDKVYRLIDEYSLFYLRFIEDTAFQGEGTFMQLSQMQEYKIWCGYAYEGICMKHIPQIKKALGVGGVYTTTYSFLKKATKEEKGLQIGYANRNEQIVSSISLKSNSIIQNLCLLKPMLIKLENGCTYLCDYQKQRKLVLTSMITTFGLKHNKHSLGLVDPVLTLDDLFS